jgi:hypothetical protein
MQACFGYNPFSDKNKIPGLLRKCLSFLYEPHTNMLVLFLLTAVNLETMWCIHVCHRCHVDVFLQVTVLFQVDFFVEWARGSAGGRPLLPPFVSVTADLRFLSAHFRFFVSFAVLLVDGSLVLPGCYTVNLGYHG